MQTHENNVFTQIRNILETQRYANSVVFRQQVDGVKQLDQEEGDGWGKVQRQGFANRGDAVRQ